MTPTASEPVLERVVVQPGGHDSDAAHDDGRPARRGWWQRKFGGE
jgi:hypothetical protein